MSNGGSPEAHVAEPGTSPRLFETEEIGDKGVVAVYMPLTTGKESGGMFFSWVHFPGKNEADTAIEGGVAFLDKAFPKWEATYATVYVRDKHPRELPAIDTTVKQPEKPTLITG